MIIECTWIPPHDGIHLSCCSSGLHFSIDASFGIVYIGGVCCSERTGSDNFPRTLSPGWYLSADYFASFCKVEFCPFCGERLPGAV